MHATNRTGRNKSRSEFNGIASSIDALRIPGILSIPLSSGCSYPGKKNSGKMKRQSIKKKSNVEMAGIT